VRKEAIGCKGVRGWVGMWECTCWTLCNLIYFLVIYCILFHTDVWQQENVYTFTNGSHLYSEKKHTHTHTHTHTHKLGKYKRKQKQQSRVKQDTIISCFLNYVDIHTHSHTPSLIIRI
jgi:hypothetical protein